MANKTIPELNEIDTEDLSTDHLLIMDTATETFKVRFSSMIAFFRTYSRTEVNVVLDGSETGDQTIDVTSEEILATKMIWMLRKPDNTQMPAIEIQATDDDTVLIKLGEFSLPAGTYKLLGV